MRRIRIVIGLATRYLWCMAEKKRLGKRPVRRAGVTSSPLMGSMSSPGGIFPQSRTRSVPARKDVAPTEVTAPASSPDREAVRQRLIEAAERSARPECRTDTSEMSDDEFVALLSR